MQEGEGKNQSLEVEGEDSESGDHMMVISTVVEGPGGKFELIPICPTVRAKKERR